MAADAVLVSGWDIGGVNVKASLLSVGGGRIAAERVVVRPFEIWREPRRLAQVLRDVAGDLGAPEHVPCAVTMTAELSDAFRTRGEGVLHVLDAVGDAFATRQVHVLDTAGSFHPLGEARLRPLDFAATNWVASALFAAARAPDCILVDVGSTTTDIVPLRGRRVVARGRTDAERLAAGELVYSGVLRTNPNCFARTVPLRGRPCRVAAEWFTQTADVYLVLGRISAADYTCPTPDGRGVTAAEARARLARLVCEDAEVQSASETLLVARYLAEAQARQLGEGILQVLAEQPRGSAPPLLAAGLGAFLVRDLAPSLGLAVLDPRTVWDGLDAVALPACAVAALLARESQGPASWT